MNLAVKNNKQLQRKNCQNKLRHSLLLFYKWNKTSLKLQSVKSKKDCGFVKFNPFICKPLTTHFLLNLDVFFLLKKSHVTFLGLFSLAQLKLSWMSTISCIVSFKKTFHCFLDEFTRKEKDTQ